MHPEQVFWNGGYGGYAPPLISVSVGTTLTLSFPPTITYKNLFAPSRYPMDMGHPLKGDVTVCPFAGTLRLDKVP